MAYLNPLDMGELPELQAVFQGAREAMGFVPNRMRASTRLHPVAASA